MSTNRLNFNDLGWQHLAAVSRGDSGLVLVTAVPWGVGNPEDYLRRQHDPDGPIAIHFAKRHPCVSLAIERLVALGYKIKWDRLNNHAIFAGRPDDIVRALHIHRADELENFFTEVRQPEKMFKPDPRQMSFINTDWDQPPAGTPGNYIKDLPSWPGLIKIGQSVNPDARAKSTNNGQPVPSRGEVKFRINSLDPTHVEKTTVEEFKSVEYMHDDEWVMADVAPVARFMSVLDYRMRKEAA